MDTRELLPGAFEPVVAVVETLGPDSLDRPTPCTDFDVRALVNHFAGTTAWIERVGRRAAPDADDPFGAKLDVTTGEWRALLVERIRAVGVAWADPAAWEGAVEGVGMPASMIGEMAVAEVLTHGWDLAAATGQPLKVDEDAATAVHRFMVETGELGRQGAAYGPEVAVPAEAPTFDRALGLSGRDPHWTPVP